MDEVVQATEEKVDLTKNLPFKVGDKVKGLLLSDLIEDEGKEILDRQETIIEITSDGDEYFFIKTDYTETLREELEKKNAELGEDDNKLNLDWLINSKENMITVVNEITPENITKIGATIQGDFICFDTFEIPYDLLASLKPFVDKLEDKHLLEVLDVENEVQVVISGMEFTVGMLKTIFGKD